MEPTSPLGLPSTPNMMADGAPRAHLAAFGNYTPSIARKARSLFLALLLAIAAYAAGVAWKVNFGLADGASILLDITAFWAAAKLAVAGQAISAFDPHILFEAMALPSNRSYPYYYWHYPPLFHLLIAPLGLLGFSAAFAVFNAVTFGAYTWALSLWTKNLPGGVSLAATAPPVVLTLAVGNSSLLWSAIFLAAFAAQARARPVAAGALIALLTFKPQLGVLIPVALIAGRHWPTIAWSIAWSVVMIALTSALFGLEYWQVFLMELGNRTEQFEASAESSAYLISWYANLRQGGLSHDTALVFQLGGSAFAAGIVAWTWSMSRVSQDLKIAALCLATLVATPYAFGYELVLAIIAALFLARAGIGRTMAGRAWLAALWLLLVPAWFSGFLEVSHYVAPFATASLVYCAWIALRPAARPAAA